MIPLAAITAWSNTFPWANPHFVEQDLVLCRVLIDLFNDGFENQGIIPTKQRP